MKPIKEGKVREIYDNGDSLAVALIFAPRFGIAFVWLAVPAGWFANFLISYMALRKSWPVSTVCNSVANG